MTSDFEDAVQDVKEALEDMRFADAQAAEARDRLATMERMAAESREHFELMKRAFHKQFPEMAPSDPHAPLLGVPNTQVTPAMPQAVPSPQGPLVFRELSDNPFDVPGGM